MEIPERLKAYYARHEAMSLPDKAAHARDDHREPDQAWPDFLDFLDEWMAMYSQKLQQTRKDYVYTALARHGTTIKCRDHQHTFSDQPHDLADVIIPSPDVHINPDVCWWKEITKHDRMLRDVDEHATALQLSSPEAKAIQKLTAIQMVTQESLPPTLLTFEQFQKEWWKTPTQERAARMLMESDQPYFMLQAAIADIKVQDVPNPPRWLNIKTDPKEDIILPNDSVLSDHGLHALLRVRNDRHEIFRMISSIRTEVNPEGKLKPARLREFIERCEFCSTPHAISTSYRGIYYSPPGNGKSTALEKEAFVGVDTDWLLKNSTYDKVIRPFIEKNIPVITNQYHLSTGSGTRFFGSFNPEQLRINPMTNIPYTTLTEIEKARSILKADLFLIFTDKFFADTLPLLYRAAYLYEFSQYVWLKKSVKSKFIRHHLEDGNIQTVLQQMRKWTSSTRASAKQNRRRRNR